MAKIELKNIRHAYAPHPKGPEDYALKDVDLTWDDGGAYALLGPSGCGKTTLLNIISGLLTPSEGALLFDGEEVTDLSTEERNIAQVFQFPVVYDTMSVFDNLAFPLRNRGVPEADVRRRVQEILDITDLASKAKRKAAGLTADEKQKISLGRGLVRSDVNAILFDEPLTVIDPHMKWVLRSQLKHLHKRFGFTMVYVTHDQTEALTFADKVVVMYEGEIVQVGTPDDLFQRPQHTFVGYFIGSPGMNVLPCALEGGRARIGGHAVPLPADIDMSAATGKMEIGVRPEFVTLTEDAGGLPLHIDKVEDIGRYRIVRATMDGHALNAVVPEGVAIPETPRARFDDQAVNLYADSWLVGSRSNAATGG